MSKRQLVDGYLKGQISRRVFIRRLVAIGVSLSAALSYANLLSPELAFANGRPGDYGPGSGGGSGSGGPNDYGPGGGGGGGGGGGSDGPGGFGGGAGGGGGGTGGGSGGGGGGGGHTG